MVLELISEGEGEQLDFKQEITDRKKIAKTLVAFANTNGGKLLVGVKDNGRIKGVDIEEEKQMLLWAGEKFCKPVIPIDFEVEHVNGVNVLIATVNKSKEKPHYAQDEKGKWWAYIRVKDQCLLASKVLLDVMRFESKGLRPSINYGESEELLLHHLKENEHITLKQFQKLSRVSRPKCIAVLVNMLRMNIIKVKITESEEVYFLAE